MTTLHTHCCCALHRLVDSSPPQRAPTRFARLAKHVAVVCSPQSSIRFGHSKTKRNEEGKTKTTTTNPADLAATLREARVAEAPPPTHLSVPIELAHDVAASNLSRRIALLELLHHAVAADACC